jgi:hypothetical protein
MIIFDGISPDGLCGAASLDLILCRLGSLQDANGLSALCNFTGLRFHQVRVCSTQVVQAVQWSTIVYHSARQIHHLAFAYFAEIVQSKRTACGKANPSEMQIGVISLGDPVLLLVYISEDRRQLGRLNS